MLITKLNKVFNEIYLIKFIVTLVLVFTICGCQSINNNQQAKLGIPVNLNLFIDQDFPSYKQVQVESVKNIFKLDEDIQTLVNEELLPIPNKTKRAERLLRLIFQNKDQGINYLSSANIVASEAFHSNTANCLSLTIMAYALATKADLEIRFQEIDIPEFWIRNGQYSMLTGHVNLLILAPKNPQLMVVFGSTNLQIDFDPYIAKKQFSRHLIDKSKVVAMFYNNKAAQAIVDNKYDVAYAYLKSAIVTLPTYSNSWGNLGLLYRLTNHYDFAEKTYQYALSLDKNNFTTLSNYSILLKMNGDIETHKLIQNKIEKKRRENPYYYAMLGDEAAFKNDFKKALQYYKKAINLNRNIHEFYYGLAKVYYRLNAVKKAKKAMGRAIKLNKVAGIDDQYIAKLNFFKSTEFTH